MAEAGIRRGIPRRAAEQGLPQPRDAQAAQRDGRRAAHDGIFIGKECEKLRRRGPPGAGGFAIRAGRRGAEDSLGILQKKRQFVREGGFPADQRGHALETVQARGDGGARRRGLPENSETFLKPAGRQRLLRAQPHPGSGVVQQCRQVRRRAAGGGERGKIRRPLGRAVGVGRGVESPDSAARAGPGVFSLVCEIEHSVRGGGHIRHRAAAPQVAEGRRILPVQHEFHHAARAAGGAVGGHESARVHAREKRGGGERKRRADGQGGGAGVFLPAFPPVAGGGGPAPPVVPAFRHADQPGLAWLPGLIHHEECPFGVERQARGVLEAGRENLRRASFPAAAENGAGNRGTAQRAVRPAEVIAAFPAGEINPAVRALRERVQTRAGGLGSGGEFGGQDGRRLAAVRREQPHARLEGAEDFPAGQRQDGAAGTGGVFRQRARARRRGGRVRAAVVVGIIHPYQGAAAVRGDKQPAGVVHRDAERPVHDIGRREDLRRRRSRRHGPGGGRHHPENRGGETAAGGGGNGNRNGTKHGRRGHHLSSAPVRNPSRPGCCMPARMALHPAKASYPSWSHADLFLLRLPRRGPPPSKPNSHGDSPSFWLSVL